MNDLIVKELTIEELKEVLLMWWYFARRHKT